jgi:hypothetical protein
MASQPLAEPGIAGEEQEAAEDEGDHHEIGDHCLVAFPFTARPCGFGREVPLPA